LVVKTYVIFEGYQDVGEFTEPTANAGDLHHETDDCICPIAPQSHKINKLHIISHIKNIRPFVVVFGLASAKPLSLPPPAKSYFMHNYKVLECMASDSAR
jgi:hypothetical protein